MPYENSNSNEEPVAPEHKITAGNIEGALWPRYGQYGPLYSLKLTRYYKDKETDERKSTNYLGEKDLNDAIRVLSESIEYIGQKKMEYRLAIAQKERRERMRQEQDQYQRDGQSDFPAESSETKSSGKSRRGKSKPQPETPEEFGAESA